MTRAQVPNALTIARFFLIPAYVALILTCDGGRSWPAAIVFGVAGVTDQVDGFLARRWHVESAFGKFADPLADRLMIDAAVILLIHAGRLPWLALIIPARDLVTLVGTPIMLGRGYEFRVNLVGKAATWVLYAARDSSWSRTRPRLAGMGLLDGPRPALVARGETRWRGAWRCW